MHRFLLLLSVTPALLTGCFNPTGGGTASDPSTSSDATTTNADTTTVAPTSAGPTTLPSDTTTTGTTSIDPTLTTLPDTTSTTLPGTTTLPSTTTLPGTTTLPDTTGTTDIGSMCGNGIIELGETCDDGNMIDSDECPGNCTPAQCGDGFVYAGVEQCDDGNLLPNDGCEPDCKSSGPLLMFLVDKPTNAIDLKPPAVDAMCTALATSKYPNRKFAAWISTQDFPVSDRLGPDKGRSYASTDNKPVAKDRTTLFKGMLQNSIASDVNGTPIMPAEDVLDCNLNTNLVWTGTNIAGMGTKNDCVNWTTLSMAQSATVGSFAATDGTWTNKCQRTCVSQLRYYCVEVQQ